MALRSYRRPSSALVAWPVLVAELTCIVVTVQVSDAVPDVVPQTAPLALASLPGFVGCPTRHVASGAPTPRISALTELPRFEVGKGVIAGCCYLQRWSEDWSFLRDDPARSRDFFDPVKFIRLNDDLPRIAGWI